MTLQQVMERVGSKKSGLVRVFVNDAFRELEGLIPEDTTHALYSIVADTKLYSMPTNMVRLLGVYRKFSTSSTSVYIQIGRPAHINITEPADSTAADAGTDIIVI